jgi:ubiquinone biosynthesis protein Coq4/ribosomal protein S18 acetylase RimI-like enzyme
MQVPSMSWLQARLDQLRQLQGTLPSNALGQASSQTAMFESLEALLSMFFCQIQQVDDFAALGQLSRALIGTEAQALVVQALKADPACAALIQERYLPPRHDLFKLRLYPQDSLGYAYAARMKDTELYPDLYSDIAVDSDVSYVEARLGQTHDLWHLVTGFDTSVAAEIGLQAFHLAQFPYPLAAMLLANALVSDTLLEPSHLPKLLAAIEVGWQLGKQSQPLFAQKWEQAWEKPLAQLRQELNLPVTGAGQPQQQRSYQPSSSQATAQIRPATPADISFLAEIIYEASLPPSDHSFWEDILQGTGTGVLSFLEAMLRQQASNWGNVEDFLILSEQGKPLAAAAGYTPNLEDFRPLRLAQLDKIAQDLNWSPETSRTFSESYQEFWGDDSQPIFLAPLTPWTIENVAVLPNARGRGLGKAMVKALLEEGRKQQHTHAGIMVVNGNDIARHTYESIGFKLYQTIHADYFSNQFGQEFSGFTKLGMRLA